MSDAYTIAEHQHRLAAWAAGRAASVKGCRFTVQQAKGFLEAAGFVAEFASPTALPSPVDMDRTHRSWRKAIVKAAKAKKIEITHGVAAKLINIYLKVRFVCGGHHEHERVKCLHPPIDAVLLNELARENLGGLAKQWRKYQKRRWSNFDSATYEQVVEDIRSALDGEPFWKIEEHWEGHQ